MLNSRMTNQEEGEVEDELDALQAQVAGNILPDVPSVVLPQIEKDQKQTPEESAHRRAQVAEATRSAKPMLA